MKIQGLIPVSGNKVRVCYYLCTHHTTERVFVVHIISEIARCYFILKKNVLYISYHMRHIIITNKQYFLSLKQLSTFTTVRNF